MFSSEKYSVKEHYITEHPSVEWWEKHINSSVLKQYSDLLTGTVADIGCNHGACTIIASRNPSITSIVGIDLNDDAIQKAEELLNATDEEEDIKRKISYRVSDLRNMNVSDNTFDSAFCFHVLEHIYEYDIPAVIQEIRRILKPDGIFVVTVPFEHAYDDGIYHVTFFNEHSLQKLFSDHQFEIIECYRDQRADAYMKKNDCITLVCKNRK